QGIGLLQQATGQPAQALISLQDALAVWEKLVPDHPQVPRFRSGLASAYCELAAWHTAANHSGEARHWNEHARSLQEALVREYPEIPECKLNLNQSERRLESAKRVP